MKYTLFFIVLLFTSAALYAHERESGCESKNGTHSSNNEFWFTGSFRAMLCQNCGFGSKKDNCVICGKWLGSGRIPAYLCSNCGFGSNQNNCILCGKWVGGNGIPACICTSCGFGNKRDNCAKCGRWRGGN